jgi:uncharacterized membrane protein
MATASLVLGILALLGSVTVFVGVILGVLAVVFGIVGLRRARRGGAGHGRAVGGLVTGGIGLVLSVALVAVGLSLLSTKAGKTYQSCLNHATTTAQRNACARQFVKHL